MRQQNEARNIVHGPEELTRIDLFGDNEDIDLPQYRIEHVKLVQDFIEEIKNATLENGKLNNDVIERLRNPDPEPVDIDDPDVRLSLDLYMSCVNASEETYNNVQLAIMRRFPGTEVLSHYLVKKLVSDTTGVVSILDDMCINSCHAFTGPFTDLDACSICGEVRSTYVSSARS